MSFAQKGVPTHSIQSEMGTMGCQDRNPDPDPRVPDKAIHPPSSRTLANTLCKGVGVRVHLNHLISDFNHSPLVGSE